MARKRRPAQDRYQRDALLETQLRYGEQEGALAQLLASERSTRNSTIKSAEGAARVATKLAQSSREPLRKTYHEAGLTRQEANADVDVAIAGLGAAADIFKGAIARERGQAKTRIAESQASALRGVEERVGQIALGAQSSRAQADARWGRAKRDIGQAFVDLGAQKGMFAALTVSKAKEAQRQRNADWKKVVAQTESRSALQEDDQAFKAGENAKDRAVDREKAAKKAKNPVSREARVSAKDKFDKATQLAFRLRTAPQPAKESEIIEILTGKDIPPLIARAAAQTVIGGGAGKKTKRQVKQRYGIAVPAFTPSRNRRAKGRVASARSRTPRGAALGGAVGGR